MIIDLSLPSCDVRDVALSHIRAMILPEAVSNRHIICSSKDLMTFKDVATILDSEFASKGYRIPLTIAPTFLVKIVSFFDKTLRMVKFIFKIEYFLKI